MGKHSPISEDFDIVFRHLHHDMEDDHCAECEEAEPALARIRKALEEAQANYQTALDAWHEEIRKRQALEAATSLDSSRARTRE